jgi:DUF1680 family protein
MSEHTRGLTRRQMIGRTAAAAAATAITPIESALGNALNVEATLVPPNAVAGVDRVVMRNGKTYLSGWAGYGARPTGRGRRGGPPPEPAGPPPITTWRKKSGPGSVKFADAKAVVTTATFSAPGEYVLELLAENGAETATSTLIVKVENPPPAAQLIPVVTKRHTISSPLWKERTKTLITTWIPHCIAQCESTTIPAGRGDGGLDNFIEAAKALRGEPHAYHRGYVFSNAWVHQTMESMCLALMVDPEGDQEIIAAQERMKVTIDKWIPIILGAQHPDGYLQTAYTLKDMRPRAADGTLGPVPGGSAVLWTERWQPSARANHEGYVSGYFLESAINHYSYTEGKDRRLYDAAKKLADCWADNLGPAPKKEWYDGHQEMEQALVRFGRFVNQMEGGGKGDRYIATAKWLLDCKRNGSEYDQSHLPVIQQYEAVGHAVRAVYSYSGMADVSVETHDVDYQSATKSIWDNIVHKKYYVTGGVGSGESAEGFGPNYSLRNNAYCEACSSCGEIFFQWKLHLAYHHADYVNLYEQTMYNALMGSLAHDGKSFFYTNPMSQVGNRSSWHSVPCCTGNIPRTLLMLPTWMYSLGTDGIYVNLFAGSAINVGQVKGTDVELVQNTNYPWDGKVSITVNPKAEKSFAMKLRVPVRDISTLYSAAPKADGITSVMVNGKAEKPKMVDGYAVIDRKWKAGDKVDFVLPMAIQRLHGSDKIYDASARPAGAAPNSPAVPATSILKDRVALRYGPLVYSIEGVDQSVDSVLPPNAPLSTEWRSDLLGGVTVIKGTFANGSPMMAIPYYKRHNRQPPAPPPAPPASPPVAGTPPTPQPPRPPASVIWIKEA